MDPRLLLIFISGFVGGTGAYLIGAPMPYMLGGIFGAACFVLWYERGELRLGVLLHRRHHLGVPLDLRLGAGAAQRDDGARREAVRDHVARLRRRQLRRPALDVGVDARVQVAHAEDRVAADGAPVAARAVAGAEAAVGDVLEDSEERNIAVTHRAGPPPPSTLSARTAELPSATDAASRPAPSDGGATLPEATAASCSLLRFL